jgi:Cu-Zn family superoxide dismutase
MLRISASNGWQVASGAQPIGKTKRYKFVDKKGEEMLSSTCKTCFGIVAMVVLFGCDQSPQEPQREPSPSTPTGPAINKAMAVIYPTIGNTVRGTISFSKGDGHIQVVANLTGLPAGEHGFHIHQYGDASTPDGTLAGGHFNPADKSHSGPDSEERHVGDLGNISANENGVATLDRNDTLLSLDGPNSILGRGVIIHAGADDLTSQPTGAAGARLGIGVIGVAKQCIIV